MKRNKLTLLKFGFRHRKQSETKRKTKHEKIQNTKQIIFYLD